MLPEGRALEFLIAGVIALIVVGPKDLPVLMRKLGKFVGRMRSMAAEFRASFDEMARQSELDELRKEVEAMRHAQLADAAGRADMHEAISDIHQSLTEVGAELKPSAPAAYYEAPSTPAPEAQPAPKPRAKRAAAATPKSPAASKPKVPAKPRARKKTAEPGS
jgi:sec-independent protein translocase protein TatB